MPRSLESSVPSQPSLDGRSPGYPSVGPQSLSRRSCLRNDVWASSEWKDGQKEKVQKQTHRKSRAGESKPGGNSSSEEATGSEDLRSPERITGRPWRPPGPLSQPPASLCSARSSTPPHALSYFPKTTAGQSPRYALWVHRCGMIPTFCTELGSRTAAPVNTNLQMS